MRDRMRKREKYRIGRLSFIDRSGADNADRWLAPVPAVFIFLHVKVETSRPYVTLLVLEPWKSPR